MERDNEIPSTIIHISDLHLKSDMLSGDISIIQKDESYLDLWIDKIKEICPEERLLLISGDLTDQCEKDELDLAMDNIKYIVHELEIDKKNVIICPGNHDFNFRDFKDSLIKRGIKDPKEFKKHNDLKFKNFGDFYNSFFEGNKPEFNPEIVIFDKIIDKKRKLIYLGMNSLYHESQMFEDHYGYFKYSSLTKELKSLDEQYDEYCKIAIMHHTPFGFGEKGSYIKDWETKFERVFRQHKISTFFCGHIHATNAMSKQTVKNQNVISVGSFGKDFNDSCYKNAFNIYKWGESQEGSEGFIPSYYFYETPPDSSPYWQLQHDNQNLLRFISIRAKMGDVAAIEALNKPIQTSIEKKQLFSAIQSEQSLDSQYAETDETFESSSTKYITQVIKDNTLYKSGHYHWSKFGRSHSYIKTQHFFEKYNCFEKIKSCYLSAIDQAIKDGGIKTDLLVGYSMQGCIIGTLIAIQKGWKFTYFPEIDKLYADIERTLPEGKYENITVLIDIVYTFNIIKRIIKVLRNQYTGLETVNIFSLFYSKKANGNENPDVDRDITEYIQSERSIKCLYSIESQKIKINFSFIQETCINGCPFKKVDDCIIYKEHLDTIHILYSEDKHENN